MPRAWGTTLTIKISDASKPQANDNDILRFFIYIFTLYIQHYQTYEGWEALALRPVNKLKADLVAG